MREDGSPYYVGKGSNGRWKSKQYGVEVPSPDRVIFPITDTSEEWAHFVEMEFIYLYCRLNDGTGLLENFTDGGEGASGRILTEEHKRKISEAKKGKPRSEEARRKISEGKKGKPRSEETKRKIGEASKGNRHSRGKTLSVETKQKISLALLGNQRTKGKMWITNKTHSCLINKTDPIPEGYMKGRTV